MHPVPIEEFEDLVADALDRLPPQIAAQFRNVAVVVEDERPGEPGLLGLYQGVPITQRRHYSGVLPDRITLFRLPLCRVARDRDDLARQVAITVVHEFGHHMGMSEGRLHDFGVG